MLSDRVVLKKEEDLYLIPKLEIVVNESLAYTGKVYGAYLIEDHPVHVAHILRPYNIRVPHKPIFTLRRLLTNVKAKDKAADRSGAVYKIHCSSRQVTYIVETSRNFTKRLTKHKLATEKGDLNNNIAEHHLKTSHAIDWNSATCLSYSTD